jgi:hypothetical protein
MFKDAGCGRGLGREKVILKEANEQEKSIVRRLKIFCQRILYMANVLLNGLNCHKCIG